MARKRGRPPVDPDKAKAEYLDVRLEVAEKEAFKEAADLAGLALSAWVRERLRLAARDEMQKGGRTAPLQGRSGLVPVTTLDPEPFELAREIQVVVQPDDDSFVATFFDANINASGETQQDAVA